MRCFRSVVSVVVVALGGLAFQSCGLPDVFQAAGVKGDVVVTYLGATDLNTGDRVAIAVSVVVGGEPVPDPRLRFSSSDTIVLRLTSIGDTLLACHSGQGQLLTYLISSMVSDTAPVAVDSIHVTGGGQPLPPCP